ncbi:hypothetical protein O181_078295 [Austropuccinia psidii MF-1]|uniref:Uncharacterized protein n=1 Tax=Austropuccinia psidii MF-1 TaxID=1389203 RepID=A0A9Q3FJI3_9BASI|nr:hypothetical protein [Austropuccinia psidii MF-1]
MPCFLCERLPKLYTDFLETDVKNVGLVGLLDLCCASGCALRHGISISSLLSRILSLISESSLVDGLCSPSALRQSRQSKGKMRCLTPLYAHRPVVHPILGPTIHRPTHLIPTSCQTKRPIPLEVLQGHQLNLPPPPAKKSSTPPDIKTSIKLVRRVLGAARKATPEIRSDAQLWPTNLRVEDNWKGRGRWGEGRPDHLEWLGVPKKHKELMISLRAER